MADQQKSRQTSAEAKGKAAAQAVASQPDADATQTAPEAAPPAVPEETPPEELKGDALTKRAQELNIEGRSEMGAEDLRDAIAEAERKQREPQNVEEKREGAAHDSRTFTKTRLLVDGPGLLGYPLHEVALGLNDVDDDTELSVADAQKHIAEALERPLED